MARPTIAELQADKEDLQQEVKELLAEVKDLQRDIDSLVFQQQHWSARAERAEHDLQLSRTVNGNLMEVLTNLSIAVSR